MKINYLLDLLARPFGTPYEWNLHAKKQKPRRYQTYYELIHILLSYSYCSRIKRV